MRLQLAEAQRTEALAQWLHKDEQGYGMPWLNLQEYQRQSYRAKAIEALHLIDKATQNPFSWSLDS